MSHNTIKVSFGNPDIIPSEEYRAVPITEQTIAIGRFGISQEIEHLDHYPAPRVEPLCYPGRTPETSFVLGEGSQILPVVVLDDPETKSPRFIMATETGAIDIDDALEKTGLTPMAERIPVVTFGSNANPGQLENKFVKLNDEDSCFVPTTKAVVHDLVPVYVPKVGMWKYSFAAMYAEDGAETEVRINWLTPAQLAHMHTTEKAYMFSQFGTAKLEGSRLSVPAYLYAGKDSVYLDESGKPVRVSECKARGSRLRAASQADIQQELFALTQETLMAQYPHLSSEDLKNDLHGMIDSMRAHDLKKVDIGKTMMEHLTTIDRVATVSLLDKIPAEDRGILEPMTLADIVGNSHG